MKIFRCVQVFMDVVFFTVIIITLVFHNRLSQHNPSCPETHSIDQTGLELRDQLVWQFSPEAGSLLFLIEKLVQTEQMIERKSLFPLVNHNRAELSSFSKSYNFVNIVFGKQIYSLILKFFPGFREWFWNSFLWLTFARKNSIRYTK